MQPMKTLKRQLTASGTNCCPSLLSFCLDMAPKPRCKQLRTT